MTVLTDESSHSPLRPREVEDQTTSVAEPMRLGDATPAQTLAEAATLLEQRFHPDRWEAEHGREQFAALVPTLERLLSNPDPEVVAGAVRSLYQTAAEPRSLAALVRGLRRPGVLEALWPCLLAEGHGGAPDWAGELVVPLVELLADGDGPQQRTAMLCLCRFSGSVLRPAVQRFGSLLTNRDAWFRHSAATQLAYVLDAEVLRPLLPQLLAGLATDTDPWFRNCLLAALGRLGPEARPMAEPVLTRLLASSDLDPEVHRQLAQTMLDLGLPEAALRLWSADLHRPGDAESEVDGFRREHAARSLAGVGEAGWVVLRAALSAPQVLARRAALKQLWLAEPARVWETVVDELRHSSDSAWRLQLLNEVCRPRNLDSDPIGTELRMSLLLELTASPDVELRQAAGDFLMKLGAGAACVPTLITALSHERFGVRLWAARKLAELGPASAAAVPALRDMAEVAEARLGAEARLALSKITQYTPGPGGA